MLLSVKFFCQKCNAETEQIATDGKFEQPTGCRECGSKNIIPDRSASVTTDWQKIRVQEMQTDETREEGKMPRTVECELADDLVDSCIPGDEVTVSGIVKVLSTDGGTGAGSKNKCLFLLYIDVNSLTVAQSKDTQDKAEKVGVESVRIPLHSNAPRVCVPSRSAHSDGCCSGCRRTQGTSPPRILPRSERSQRSQTRCT